MSYYTLSQGLLLLGIPVGFFALPVPKRTLFDSAIFSSRTKYVSSIRLGHAISFIINKFFNFVMII